MEFDPPPFHPKHTTFPEGDDRCFVFFVKLPQSVVASLAEPEFLIEIDVVAALPLM